MGMQVENHKLLNSTFIFGCVVLFLKLLLIDIDPPSWAISQYAPIDEYYYVNNAYNLFEMGNAFGKDEPMLFGNPTLTNMVTYFTLNIFGDNYLGLRFSSWMFSILSYLLLFNLLKRVKINPYIICGVLLFTIFNFTFSNASFVVEPSISRIFCILLSMHYILKWKDNHKQQSSNLIMQSALISGLWILSYPTNAFVMLGFYIVMVLDRETFNMKFFSKSNLTNMFIKSLYYLIGVVISFVIYYFISRALGLDLLDNSMNRGSKYSNRLALNIKDIIKYFLFNFRSNIFVLNPLLLIITVFALFNIELKKIKDWPILKYISFMFLISFFMQSLFINDFPERKLIIYFPLVIILIAFYLDEKNRKTSTNIYVLNKLHVFLIIGFMSVIGLVYYKYSNLDILAWIIAFVGIVFLITNQLYFNLKKIHVFNVMFLLIMVPEVINVLNYHVFNRTYDYREALKSLREFEDSEFIGGFSMGFRGYNSMQSSVNLYYYYEQRELQLSNIDQFRTNGKKDYSIDYRFNEGEMKKIGFVPLRSLLYTVDDKEWVIYQEEIIK